MSNIHDKHRIKMVRLNNEYLACTTNDCRNLKYRAIVITELIYKLTSKFSFIKNDPDHKKTTRALQQTNNLMNKNYVANIISVTSLVLIIAFWYKYLRKQGNNKKQSTDIVINKLKQSQKKCTTDRCKKKFQTQINNLLKR